MKKLGIGYENYKEFIDQNLYYVDKTLLVRDVLEEGRKVTLLTRPRRFGKTLGLSMLRTFLEDGYAGVVSYGICFCKKSCIVGLYQET